MTFTPISAEQHFANQMESLATIHGSTKTLTEHEAANTLTIEAHPVTGDVTYKVIT